MRISKTISFCLQATLISILALSCTKKTQSSASEESESPYPQELLARIEIGMSQPEVAGMLGEPKDSSTSSSGYTWYLAPPGIEPHESPYAPGTIGIKFTDAGKVASFKLNPQYQTRR